MGAPAITGARQEGQEPELRSMRILGLALSRRTVFTGKMPPANPKLASLPRMLLPRPTSSPPPAASPPPHLPSNWPPRLLHTAGRPGAQLRLPHLPRRLPQRRPSRSSTPASPSSPPPTPPPAVPSSTPATPSATSRQARWQPPDPVGRCPAAASHWIKLHLCPKPDSPLQILFRACMKNEFGFASS
ncbi:hypothetical protein BRADI_1g08025v3 [Brachypodium distachyon]|uniref:Uncharacterized protein n=1 Tax=Brachypodium distachyon TaxID=15368 RepID=A0A2K2DIJ8_BRADI|nr:hypothetical protein BRADI_1g08025v3 [Brachypodium distachyon]